MRIHALQHVAFEGLGYIGQWIADHGHSLTLTRLYAGEPLPVLADVDRLVIMGGPMNIYEDDRYPWLPGNGSLSGTRSIPANQRSVSVWGRSCWPMPWGPGWWPERTRKSAGGRSG
jgi:hypothetical protein